MDWQLDTITEIIDMGEGARVEIDFVDTLGVQEGVIVGDTARGFIPNAVKLRHKTVNRAADLQQPDIQLLS